VPLREPLLGVGERVVEYFDGGGDPPFQLYVYDPTAEWEVRREFDERVRRYCMNPRHATGHVPFMEMLEQTAVVEMQIIFRIRRVRRLGIEQGE